VAENRGPRPSGFIQFVIEIRDTAMNSRAAQREGSSKVPRVEPSIGGYIRWPYLFSPALGRRSEFGKTQVTLCPKSQPHQVRSISEASRSNPSR
jgi:hypothetical protein